MENERAIGTAESPVVQQSTGAAQPATQVGVVSNAPPPTVEHKPMKLRSGKRWLWIILGIIAALMVIGGAFVVFNTPQSGNVLPLKTGEYDTVQIPLSDLQDLNVLTGDSTKSLKVNGQLSLSGALILDPSPQPANPVRGQMYFDQTANQLRYYDGDQFIAVLGTPASNTTNTVTNNITNITNIFNQSGGESPPPGVLLQATASGIQQAGNFNVSGVGQVGTLRTGTVSNDSAISITTDATAGTTGNITIKSGDSSTTASGNVTIDAGEGVIDGEEVGHKSFESGVENMQAWFSTNIAQTTEQAHDGVSSLGTTVTGSFGWGVIEDQGGPGTVVIPGHQYFVSFWVRAKTTPRNIAITLDWTGAGASTPLTTITDSTTEWKEVTGLVAAPAGATKLYFHAQSGSGAIGEVHYFDDITITDLSSGSAVSSIDIGSSNAKIVTIGNLNQVGATTIRGGSGVDIQSGSAGTTINGGTVNITGNAASTVNTTSGALILTSATSTTWGVNTASTGAGGNLTLRAGAGAFGNNDGGDLLLQGGNRTGTGLAGSVIARAQTDATDTFLIQNSTSVNLFAADTANMRIIISGAGGVFANLVLADAHFSSTQTTAPTINTPTDCGTTPTAAVTAGSTDSAGSFTITTGTGGTSAACDTTITFNHAYGAAPKSIMVVGNSDALSVARQVYVSNSTATTFTVRFATSAAGADNTMYSFNYWVVE